MKILHVNNPASVGYMLCKELRNRGIDSEVVLVPTLTDTWSSRSWVHQVRNKFDKLFLKGMDLKKYDLIHLHSALSWFSLGVKINAPGTPVILQFHGTDTRPENMFYKYLLRNYMVKESKIVLYSTPDLKSNLVWFKGRKKYLPNPIEIPKKIKKNEKYENRILIFATLDKIKKIEKIFQIIKHLNYRFDIFDTGPDKEYYKKIAPKNVVFIRPIKNEKVKERISKYHLVIGGSQDGTIRRSELEAMSLGVPTLFPFKYNNFYPKKLPMPKFNEKNIGKFFGDYELGRKQRDWVKKYHDVKVVVDELLDIYNKLIK